MSPGPALLVAVVLLALNGFFVAAEFALLASRRSRIEQLAADGDRRARRALAGLRELSLMLAGAQLGITMCSIGLGVVAEPALARLIEHALDAVGLDLPSGALHGLSFTLGLSIVVFLHMVVGEMAPKSWAIAHPERSALALALPFRAFATVFRPVIRILNATANGVVRLLRVEPTEELAGVHSPAELLLLVRESASSGGLLPEDRHLLTRSLELSGHDAEAVMTPRHGIVSVEHDAPLAEVERRAVETGRSRIVVTDGDLDHAVGTLHVRELLTRDEGLDGPATAGDLCGRLLVVPADRRLEDVFLDMQAQRRMLALVVDEHGVVLGLVTMEDLLEELVGAIEDESDRAARECRRLPDGTWLVAGHLRPDEIADETGIVLPEGDWETVGGLLMAHLGRVPEPGDRLDLDQVALEVRSLDGFAVQEVRLAPRRDRLEH